MAMYLDLIVLEEIIGVVIHIRFSLCSTYLVRVVACSILTQP